MVFFEETGDSENYGLLNQYFSNREGLARKD